VTWLSSHWRGSLVAASVVIAAGGAALMPAPAAIAEMSPSPRAYAAVLSAALSGAFLLTLATGRFRIRPALTLAGAACLLALGAGAYYYSGAVQSRCTARYSNRDVLIGSELTTVGREFKSLHPDETPADFLENSHGDATLAWTRESIESCRSRIASTYFAWIPFFVASLATAALGASARRIAVPAALAHKVEATTVPPRYDAFISYRRGGADADVAQQLLETLEADGYTVAIDQRDFPGNASFLQEMERCIRESRFTIAIVSARYLESGNCEEEAIVCKVLDMGQRRRRLIPFVIQSVEMPAWLFGIVGIDCTTPDPLVDPIEKLEATLGPPLTGRASDAAV
jgi:hypothetical protein